MIKRYCLHTQHWHLLMVVGLFIVFASSLTSVEYAASGCPPVSNNGWAQCKKVYYSVGGFNVEQYGQILNGIDTWIAANQTNNSRVEFIQGTPPAGSINHGTLNIVNGTTSGGDPAETIKNTSTGALQVQL